MKRKERRLNTDMKKHEEKKTERRKKRKNVRAHEKVTTIKNPKNENNSISNNKETAQLRAGNMIIIVKGNFEIPGLGSCFQPFRHNHAHTLLFRNPEGNKNGREEEGTFPSFLLEEALVCWIWDQRFQLVAHHPIYQRTVSEP